MRLNGQFKDHQGWCPSGSCTEPSTLHDFYGSLIKGIQSCLPLRTALHRWYGWRKMAQKDPKFRSKNFILASLNSCHYHLISYYGAKGIVGTPGKDLTSRVVIEFLLEYKNGEANIAFDNWHALTKLMSILNALNMHTICTAWTDHVRGSVIPIHQTNCKRRKRDIQLYLW